MTMDTTEKTQPFQCAFSAAGLASTQYARAVSAKILRAADELAAAASSFGKGGAYEYDHFVESRAKLLETIAELELDMSGCGCSRNWKISS